MGPTKLLSQRPLDKEVYIFNGKRSAAVSDGALACAWREAAIKAGHGKMVLDDSLEQGWRYKGVQLYTRTKHPLLKI